jgi:hypothetical protein
LLTLGNPPKSTFVKGGLKTSAPNFFLFEKKLEALSEVLPQILEAVAKPIFSVTLSVAKGLGD